MILAKTDLKVAKCYAELVEDGELGTKIFSVLQREYELTTSTLNDITESNERLADNPGLARSIRHRLPYITALNHLQIELLRRWRQGDQDEMTRRGILTSINGIAAGLRNTG
jgi:phosphoenolpyruvate carboxylase